MRTGRSSLLRLCSFLLLISLVWAFPSLTRAGESANVIVVDISKKSPPISEYIYGQFIEHLGRCIYGGIWAEMLQDRKFFYAVGAEGSPWQVIGPRDCVKMDRNEPFVGVHSPRVFLSGDGGRCGLSHGDLGIVSGKRYTGYVWIRGDSTAAPIEVALAWGDSGETRVTYRIDSLTAEYKKHEFQLQAGTDSDNARLEITSTGKGSFQIGTLSLMPADNIQGMRADTIALLKELNSPIYRWPGGNFVSGYDWRDGIGDRDRRPPRKNPAWQGIEHNDFGIDEFMTFCRVVNTEPLVVVNTGLGDLQMALEELEYANGSADSPMGKLRAKNGNPEPYNVRYWGIGNEMYGNWQLGHMPLEDYVKKHNEFVAAMRKMDPRIKVVAVGAVGPWTEGMFRHCADFIDLMSEHFYVFGAKEDTIEHVNQVATGVRQIAEAHRRYRREILGGREIPVALDEWNYIYGEHIFGEWGTRYFVRDGLGVAKALNEFARNTDVYAMANHAQTVNVIGAIKTTKTAAAFETTGLMLVLYRHHFGTIPVATVSENPVLDAQAAISEDNQAITIAVVNPTGEKQRLSLRLEGATMGDHAQAWEVAGNDPMDYNEPGKPLRVELRKRETSTGESLEVAPYSATIFQIPLVRRAS
ncbi:MAG: alpha-L-arabinofuranosidase C-terminal domain-containing protein [Thermogutta sp.]